MSALPPLYQHPFEFSDLEFSSYRDDANNDLPAYTRRPTSRSTIQSRHEPTEFTYDLRTTKERPWVSMTVLGNKNLSKRIPSIMEGTDITGSVKLSLEKEKSVNAVNISVRGRMVIGENSSRVFTFLNQSSTLWTNSTGDSRRPRKSDTAFDGKLHGDYEWPFSIALPKEVSVQVGPNESKVFRLPHTFLESTARATIQYEIMVHIARGRLKRDTRLRAPLGYFQDSRPGPSSLLRQLAFQLNSPPLGPDTDPDGWKRLRFIKIQGLLFNKRPVDVKCTLSLAKPLCYTRGSTIPCAMSIETDDPQMLDLLASPKAHIIRLQRCIRYHSSEPRTIAGRKSVIDHVEMATWWPSTPSWQTFNRRDFSGEIQLKIDMNPTSAIAHFCIDYQVTIFPFSIAGFKSASNNTNPLLVQHVEIVTNHATGPPEYNSSDLTN